MWVLQDMYQMRKSGWGHYLRTSPIGVFPWVYTVADLLRV